MGSPVRRLISPITRCRDKPHNRYAGTDDGRGTGQKLDAERLTLMCVRSVAVRSRSVARDVVAETGRKVLLSDQIGGEQADVSRCTRRDDDAALNDAPGKQEQRFCRAHHDRSGAAHGRDLRPGACPIVRLPPPRSARRSVPLLRCRPRLAHRKRPLFGMCRVLVPGSCRQLGLRCKAQDAPPLSARMSSQWSPNGQSLHDKPIFCSITSSRRTLPTQWTA